MVKGNQKAYMAMAIPGVMTALATIQEGGDWRVAVVGGLMTIGSGWMTWWKANNQ